MTATIIPLPASKRPVVTVARRSLPAPTSARPWWHSRQLDGRDGWSVEILHPTGRVDRRGHFRFPDVAWQEAESFARLHGLSVERNARVAP